MLVMHRHPDNKGAAPKLVNSTQRVYPRTGVDANSRWRVHWDAVGQADMSAGIDSMSLKHVVVAVQCEEGSLAIECELVARSMDVTHSRASMAPDSLLDPPSPYWAGRFGAGIEAVRSTCPSRWRNAL